MTVPSSSRTAPSARRQEVRAGERGDERIRRPRDEIRRAPVLAQPAVDDHADLRRERRGVLEVVGHEQRRDLEPGEQLLQLGAHLDARVRVERGERLVEEKDRRVARERAGERDALTLAAREAARPRVREVPDPEPLEVLVCRVAPRVLDVGAHREMREERVVLEDEADAPPLGRQRRRPCSNHVSSPHRIEPPLGRTSPAIALRTVLFPAPDGPTRATVAADREAYLELESPKRDGDVFEGDRCHERAILSVRSRTALTRTRSAAHRECRVLVQVELVVDRERQRLRDALEASREHDRRAELADSARERQSEPGDQPAAREREHDAEERPRRPRAERARGRRQARVDRLERGDRLPDVERARDVRDGDDDRALGERSEMPKSVESRAEQPVAAERDEQPDPRHGRRQHERELDERDRERASDEAPRREEVRRRRPEEEDQRLRDETRLQRHDEGVVDDRVRELADHPSRRRVRRRSPTIGRTRKTSVTAASATNRTPPSLPLMPTSVPVPVPVTSA